MNEGHTVKIMLFGKEHTIKSPADPQTTKQYAEYIDSLVQQISSKIGFPEPTRVAALALLQITHELFSLRDKLERDDKEFDRRMRILIDSARALVVEGGVQTEISSDLFKKE